MEFEVLLCQFAIKTCLKQLGYSKGPKSLFTFTLPKVKHHHTIAISTMLEPKGQAFVLNSISP